MTSGHAGRGDRGGAAGDGIGELEQAAGLVGPVGVEGVARLLHADRRVCLHAGQRSQVGRGRRDPWVIDEQVTLVGGDHDPRAADAIEEGRWPAFERRAAGAASRVNDQVAVTGSYKYWARPPVWRSRPNTCNTPAWSVTAEVSPSMIGPLMLAVRSNCRSRSESPCAP